MNLSNQANCGSTLTNTYCGGFVDLNNVLCLTEVTGRTCNGDSGNFTGVRAGDRGRQWVQHGITSFGIPVRAAPSRFCV